MNPTFIRQVQSRRSNPTSEVAAGKYACRHIAPGTPSLLRVKDNNGAEEL